VTADPAQPARPATYNYTIPRAYIPHVVASALETFRPAHQWLQRELFERRPPEAGKRLAQLSVASTVIAGIYDWGARYAPWPFRAHNARTWMWRLRTHLESHGTDPLVTYAFYVVAPQVFELTPLESAALAIATTTLGRVFSGLLEQVLVDHYFLDADGRPLAPEERRGVQQRFGVGMQYGVTGRVLLWVLTTLRTLPTAFAMWRTAGVPHYMTFGGYGVEGTKYLRYLLLQVGGAALLGNAPDLAVSWARWAFGVGLNLNLAIATGVAAASFLGPVGLGVIALKSTLGVALGTGLFGGLTAFLPTGIVDAVMGVGNFVIAALGLSKDAGALMRFLFVLIVPFFRLSTWEVLSGNFFTLGGILRFIAYWVAVYGHGTLAYATGGAVQLLAVTAEYRHTMEELTKEALATLGPLGPGRDPEDERFAETLARLRPEKLERVVRIFVRVLVRFGVACAVSSLVGVDMSGAPMLIMTIAGAAEYTWRNFELTTFAEVLRQLHTSEGRALAALRLRDAMRWGLRIPGRGGPTALPTTRFLLDEDESGRSGPRHLHVAPPQPVDVPPDDNNEGAGAFRANGDGTAAAAAVVTNVLHPESAHVLDNDTLVASVPAITSSGWASTLAVISGGEARQLERDHPSSSF
jgi:hypothetical protein